MARKATKKCIGIAVSEKSATILNQLTSMYPAIDFEVELTIANGSTYLFFATIPKTKKRMFEEIFNNMKVCIFHIGINYTYFDYLTNEWVPTLDDGTPVRV